MGFSELINILCRHFSGGFTKLCALSAQIVQSRTFHLRARSQPSLPLSEAFAIRECLPAGLAGLQPESILDIQQPQILALSPSEF
jgi:hypothetical protein